MSFRKKFKPTKSFGRFTDISKKDLKGYKYIVTDLDNTLLEPDAIDIPKDILDHLKEVNNDVKIIIITNNTKERVKSVLKSNHLDLDYFYSTKKPFKKNYKKIFKKYKLDKKNTLAIGDQLSTDVYGAKKFGIDVYLVKPINPNTDKWFTKINRLFEWFVKNILRVRV